MSTEAVIKLAPGVPETDFSFPYVQSMANAMSNSHFKYGAVPEAYPHNVDAVASLEARLKLYKEGGVVKGVRVEAGNPAYLVDVGNFAMIEFRYPRHPGRAHEHVDSDVNSPGRVRFDNGVAEATNLGLSQAARLSQSLEESRLVSSRAYRRQGD